MAIANAADPLKMSILQLNKHPFRLTKTWVQSRTVHSRNVSINLKNGQWTSKQILDILQSETDAQLWIVGEEAKLRKPIMSYQLILHDLQIAIDSIKKAVRLKETFKKLDDIMVSALWTQAVMRYSRCFKNSNDGYSSLDPEKYLSSKRSKLLHERLISIRDSFLAHRGENDFEHHMVVATLIQKSKKSYQFDFQVPSLNKVGHFTHNYKSIIKHMEMLHRQVTKKLEKRCRALDKMIWRKTKN